MRRSTSTMFSARSLAASAAILFAALTNLPAQSVTTTPVGAVTVTLAAGTGSARKLTALSIPLNLPAGSISVASGTLETVTASTITDTQATWTAGSLSSAATPYFVSFTSGAAAGRSYLISTTTANTATTITIDAGESVNLTTLGVVAGDSYRLLPAHTLSTLLDLSDGILGGSSATASDNILINRGGVWNTYFFNTGVTPNRWTRVALGNPSAANEVIRPDSTILYSRLGNSNITLTFTGEVPSASTRVASVRRSGLSFPSVGWPVDTTLASLQLQTIAGWVSNANANSADKVQILADGVWKTFFYDGTNWRQVALGNPIRNTEPISAVSGVLINRLGSSTSSDSLASTRPYSL